MGGEMADDLDHVRWNFTVERELNNRIDALVPWGVKAAFTRRLLEMSAEFLDKYKAAGLGLILAGELEIRAKRQEDVNVQVR